MVTLKRCRELLGSPSQLTDTQVETLRDHMQQFAEVLLHDLRLVQTFQEKNVAAKPS